MSRPGKKTKMVLNRTFIDKSDNILKIPKIYEETKRKAKIKKSPKRTIQKIIKKNKIKRKRIYVELVTSIPTEEATVHDHVDSNIYSEPNEEKYTTEANQRKKPRKNAKVLRYHMPFQKLQPRNGMRRNKRDAERDDIYILKDLDEMEFIGTDKNYDIVRAHVKNYW